MSTDINIKNKVAILEEGVNITTDASSIDFVGSGVNSSTVGNNVTVTIPGGSGVTTYYMNATVPETPYAQFSSVATTAVEQVLPWTVDPGDTEIAFVFQTPSGVPNTTQIPGGLWQFFLHFNALSINENWIIRPTVYKRDLGGTETLLFTADPEIVNNMPTVTTMYTCDGVFPATTLLTTDRLVVKIALQNTGVSTQTLNFKTEGSQHYSVAFTTLNQVISGGSVASVTGTAPIVSSGGPTPAISIPQATGSANGYLSSSDWSTFSAKLGGSGTINRLSKWTSSTALGNSLLQDNGTSMSVNTSPNSTYGFYFDYSSGAASIYGANSYSAAGQESVGVAGTGSGTGGSNNIGGAFNAFNNATLNIGVRAVANAPTVGTNVGGVFQALNGTINYAAQLQDGTQAIGKVLTCITSDGKANWVTPSSVNIYNTNGTLTGNRLVTLGTNDLTFGGFGASGVTQFTRNEGTQSAQFTLQYTTINQIINNNTDARQTARNQTVDYHQQTVQATSLLKSIQYQNPTTWYTEFFNSSSVSLFKLNISSNGLNINNAYTFPKIDGTVNQVLTTNGTGVVSWTSPTGITLTTTGTSGAATLVGDTLNIPQYTGGGTTAFIPNFSPHETYRGITINNNTAVVVAEGGVTMSTTGTLQAQSVASTNFATKQIRVRNYSTTVSGGRYQGTRGSALLWFIHGGFRYVCDFNIADTSYSSSCQQFYGLGGQTGDLGYGGVSGTLVSTLTNIVGVGSENGDANLSVFHNDATGTATKVDLGVGFPANRTVGAAQTTVYSIQLYNEPMSTEVKYEVINKETGEIANGTISTNLPLTSQGLNFFASRTMGNPSVTSTGQFDISKFGVYSL